MCNVKFLDQIFFELLHFSRAHQWEIDVLELWECTRQLCGKLELPELESPEKGPKPHDFLTRQECADLLRVSIPTLDRYIRDEGLPSVPKNPLAKTRKHRIFIRAQVEAWAQSHLSSF